MVGKASKFKTTVVPKRLGSNHNTDLVKAEAVANSANSALIDQIRAATRFRELPSIITNSTALKQFRSTCFHGWMASDNLFDDFTIDSDVLLNIVRTAFTKAFPDLAYVPQCKDIFHHTVSPDSMYSLTCSLYPIQIYDNIQTNRSNTARYAIQAVTIHLDGMPVDEVSSWVTWTRAVRLGELIYSHPCPEGSSIVKGAPNFVVCPLRLCFSRLDTNPPYLKKPQGLFMTNFVTDLARPHLQYMNTSLIDYGHPRGLLALILVGVSHLVLICEIFEFS